ncbi:PilN domain-containing protein [Azoarcus sp. PA01]|nr:PilN domain-containing protein [Azoarcus sp. PA01]
MALELRDWRLFGFDLRSLPRRWRKGWDEALAWPMFAWLSPREPVRVLLPDGAEEVRSGATAVAAPASAQPKAVAVVLPEPNVLVRELRLPPLARAELREAVALEVASLSPFPTEQVVSGWRAELRGDRLHVRLALAARDQVAAFVAANAERLGGKEPEVWADATAPIVLDGYAEGERSARLVTDRTVLVALVAGAAMLALVLALIPVLQARERLEDAEARLAALEAETESLVASRNALALGNDRIRAVRAHLDERPEVLQLIETLSALLPDDAYLTRLEIQGRQVRIGGQAANASALMDMLGTLPEFHEVKAPAPISRVAGSDKESFVIEFVLAPPGEAS